MQNALSILVVEADQDKARQIIDALKDGGWDQVHALGQISGLERAIRTHEPDIVLIDMANPDR
ncbi:MAG: two-component system response regulator, partial [Pseudomonadota bacterium]